MKRSRTWMLTLTTLPQRARRPQGRSRRSAASSSLGRRCGEVAHPSEGRARSRPDRPADLYNIPTEAPFQPIGMFPIPHMGDIPSASQTASVELLYRRFRRNRRQGSPRTAPGSDLPADGYEAPPDDGGGVPPDGGGVPPRACSNAAPLGEPSPVQPSQPGPAW